MTSAAHCFHDKSCNKEVTACPPSSFRQAGDTSPEYVKAYSLLTFITGLNNVSALDTSRPLSGSSPSDGNETAEHPFSWDHQVCHKMPTCHDKCLHLEKHFCLHRAYRLLSSLNITGTCTATCTMSTIGTSPRTSGPASCRNLDFSPGHQRLQWARYLCRPSNVFLFCECAIRKGIELTRLCLPGVPSRAVVFLVRHVYKPQPSSTGPEPNGSAN